MNDQMPIKRCAVYTRKSREDGLEQAFNSLDAQREAAEAFVASQRANGWTLLPDRYDDGGFSGGNTDRPGLKKLLEDVRAGKIDVVAVYKIDRLSRSLFDFADLLSEFEKHGVSFVSTTQLIDTSTPMGRMMLGILMTFAQYEREVIAERIRDKISATKKKGMWVGGRVPFGYRLENHKLVPDPVEAERVRFLFKRYVECGSPTLVAREMNAKGWKTRVGNPWVAQTVRKTLVQHVYVGKVFYKGEVYEGEHEAIVDEAVWKEARRMATENPPPPRRLRIGDGAPLRGILFCKECGRAMVHVCSRRGSRRYAYYVCSRGRKGGAPRCETGRIAAGEAENMVYRQIGRVLPSDAFVERLSEAGKLPKEDIRQAVENVRLFFERLFPEERKSLVGLLVERAELGPDGMDIVIRTAGCDRLARVLASHE